MLSYFLKLSMNFPVIGKAFELAQLARVVQHVFTNKLSEKMCQAGVGLKQPPAQRNAICLVDNAVWIAVVQFLKDCFSHDSGVQGGHAVYPV